MLGRRCPSLCLARNKRVCKLLSFPWSLTESNSQKANSTTPLASPHTRSGDVGSVGADADGEMCDPTSLAAVTSATSTDGAGAGGAGAPLAAAAAEAHAGGHFLTDAELAAAAASPTAAAAAATLRDRVDALTTVGETP